MGRKVERLIVIQPSRRFGRNLRINLRVTAQSSVFSPQRHKDTKEPKNNFWHFEAILYQATFVSWW